MIPPQVKAVILLALLAVGFYGGWTAQRWRSDAVIADMHDQQASAIVVAQGVVTRMTKHIAEADTVSIQKLTDAQHENDTLRNAVAAGTVRLRIKATCPSVSNSATAASVGDAGTAELDPEAGLVVSDLRAGITLLESQVAMLQIYAHTITGTQL
jgi:prophage endopeptidase